MARPSIDGRPVNIRLPEEMIREVDRRTKNRSGFIREAVQDRLDGLPKPKPRAPRVNPDLEALLGLLREQPGLTERQVSQELGWEAMRVTATVRRLSAAGSIWFPSAGRMEVIDE